MDSSKIGSAISTALDRLMLAKNRPLLSADAKKVWAEELRGESLDAIGYAIKTMMRTPNQFPEVANIIALCRDYEKANTPTGSDAVAILHKRAVEHAKAIGVDL